MIASRDDSTNSMRRFTSSLHATGKRSTKCQDDMTSLSRWRTTGGAHTFDLLLLLRIAWSATRLRRIIVECTDVTITSFHALRRWRATGGAHTFDLLLLLRVAWSA